MNSEEVFVIIEYLISECSKLAEKYVTERDLEVDYVCIFSHSETEYKQLLTVVESLGKVAIVTPTGSVFSFIPPLTPSRRNPKLLKIRKPDSTRPQRGDVDFDTDYPTFKAKYLDNKGFTLLKREDFEMIELRDDSFDVLVYFSSRPLSGQLNNINKVL